MIERLRKYSVFRRIGTAPCSEKCLLRIGGKFFCMPTGRLEYPFYFNKLYSVVPGKFFFAAQQIPVSPRLDVSESVKIFLTTPPFSAA
ncbi:MAG TPA: hypothetical protein VF410_07515, partial [Rhizomicrobium sp.]